MQDTERPGGREAVRCVSGSADIIAFLSLIAYVLSKYFLLTNLLMAERNTPTKVDQGHGVLTRAGGLTELCCLRSSGLSGSWRDAGCLARGALYLQFSASYMYFSYIYCVPYGDICCPFSNLPLFPELN